MIDFISVVLTFNNINDTVGIFVAIVRDLAMTNIIVTIIVDFNLSHMKFNL